MIQDVVKIVGFSVFEIWMQTIGIIIFLIMLCIKQENISPISWWHVFIPLYIADGLTLYFSTIVFIRAFHSGKKKDAYKRGFWILVSLSLLFLFKMLVCHMLEGPATIRASMVVAPVISVWMLLLIRVCKVN